MGLENWSRMGWDSRRHILELLVDERRLFRLPFALVGRGAYIGAKFELFQNQTTHIKEHKTSKMC